MRLDRLILKDFLSFDELDYSFEAKPLLVQGINLTDDEQETNGTGKSGLQTGIEQCITASNSRGVNDSELITYGKKQANIQLFASCDYRKERLHIDWSINLKDSNTLRLKIQKYGSESWEPVSFSSVNDGKNKISDWFAISKEDLFNYFIINNTRFKSFFKSSNTEKVALINRFSDASIVQGLEEIDTTELDEQISGLRTLAGTVVGKIELTEENLKTEQERDLELELEEKTEELDEEIEEVRLSIVTLENSIKTKESSKPITQKRIDELKLEEKANSTKKVEIETSIQKISTELQISSKSVQSAKDLLDKFKDIDFKSKRDLLEKDKLTEKEKLELLKVAKKEKDTLYTKVLTFIQGLEVKLGGAIVCPNCQHEFILDGDLETLKTKKKGALELKEKSFISVEEQQGFIDSVSKTIQELETNISSINSEEKQSNEDKNKLSVSLNQCTKSLNEIQTKLDSENLKLKSLELTEKKRIADIVTLEEELKQVDVQVKNVKSEIKLKEKEITLIEESKKTLEVSINTELIKKLEDDLVMYKKQLSTHQLNLLQKETELTNKKLWIQNFKQFRMYLANKSLGVMEYHCNRYLQGMNSDLVVKIEGFKVKADGTIKEEINAIIIRNIERTFSSFSGGERGRLLFSSILANRFMINETHPYGGLDFLAIDEVFEGVDSAGIVSLIESAKLLSIPVLLITHIALKESSDVLTLVKENGISYIK